MSATEDDHTSDGVRVFISYRRSDCQAQANGLHDGLVHRLPRASIFKDIDSIPYGADFEEHIRAEIVQCDVVLVLIGDDWLDMRDHETGVRRLEQDEDFVRLEIETALSTPSVCVVPVLVEGAKMPRRDDLPPSIQRLVRLKAIELSDGQWRQDLEVLTRAVQHLAAERQPMPTPPVPVQPAGTIGLAALDAAAIRSAISDLPRSFQTKDVSRPGQCSRCTGLPPRRGTTTRWSAGTCSSTGSPWPSDPWARATTGAARSGSASARAGRTPPDQPGGRQVTRLAPRRCGR